MLTFTVAHAPTPFENCPLPQFTQAGDWKDNIIGNTKIATKYFDSTIEVNKLSGVFLYIRNAEQNWRQENMRIVSALTVLITIGCFSASSAQAACTGSNGRGWGSGNGAGRFEMTAADKICNISFPGFIDDVRKTRTPATAVTITTAPKNGKISVVAGRGLTYTPSQGFKGRDRFCTKNTSPKVKGGVLSGCITVTVR